MIRKGVTVIKANFDKTIQDSLLISLQKNYYPNICCFEIISGYKTSLYFDIFKNELPVDLTNKPISFYVCEIQTNKIKEEAILVKDNRGCGGCYISSGDNLHGGKINILMRLLALLKKVKLLDVSKENINNRIAIDLLTNDTNNLIGMYKVHLEIDGYLSRLPNLMVKVHPHYNII